MKEADQANVWIIQTVHGTTWLRYQTGVEHIQHVLLNCQTIFQTIIRYKLTDPDV